MTLNVYFATPIDAVQPEQLDELNRVRAQVRDALTAPGFRQDQVMVFEPSQAWTVTFPFVSLDERMQKINNLAVQHSDLVLAYLPGWCHTVGVPMEIEHAASRGIPAFVIREKPSWALQQRLIYQFKDLANALDAVRTFVPSDSRKLAVKWTQTRQSTKVNPEPSTAYPDDAGFDLVYCGDDDIVIAPGGVADVPAAVAVEFPPNVWGFLVGRSSSFRNRGLLVNPAVIDPGFRGELFAIVRNISDGHQRIAPGQRVAQIVPLPALAPQMDVVHVPHLSEGTRGAKGFGSSGA